MPPLGDWRIWLFLAGRGTGKTRAGAEWIAHGVCHGEMRRIGLVGATFHDARSMMIEGESGLLGVSPGAAFEPSNRRVLWPNGAVASVISAEEPDYVRGHQFDTVWADGDRAPKKGAP
jgi:phage terminase large subunit-like protein